MARSSQSVQRTSNSRRIRTFLSRFALFTALFLISSCNANKSSSEDGGVQFNSSSSSSDIQPRDQDNAGGAFDNATLHVPQGSSRAGDGIESATEASKEAELDRFLSEMENESADLDREREKWNRDRDEAAPMEDAAETASDSPAQMRTSNSASGFGGGGGGPGNRSTRRVIRNRNTGGDGQFGAEHGRDGANDPGRLVRDGDDKAADASPEESAATSGKAENSGETLTKKPEGPPNKNRTWKRARATPNASCLSVGYKDDLPMQGMQVSVNIDGWRARVVLDCYYMNDRDRQLEGSFKLRLPDGASPYYFAFGQTVYAAGAPQPVDQPIFIDVRRDGGGKGLDLDPENIRNVRARTWQNVREARMVPKEKAAHAYIETVRRRIDPALMEWAGSGIFNARVFPLAPKQLHRVVIGYDVNLEMLEGQLLYELDLPFAEVERKVDLAIRGIDSEDVVVLPKADVYTLYKNKQKERESYHFEGEQLKDNKISVRVPKPGNIMLSGSDEATGQFSAIRFEADLPAAEAQSAPHGLFMLDTSLSSQPDNFNIYLELMEKVLTESRATMGDFNVLFFNIEHRWYKDRAVPNTEANVAALMEYCRSLALEGATDLGSALSTVASDLPLWDQKKSQKADIFLLSDGSITWGDKDVAAISRNLKSAMINALFAYRTGLGSDSRVLESLANSTGGAVFSVVNEDEIGKAASAHRNRPWQISSIEADGLSDILIAGRPAHLYPGQKVTLAARGAFPQGKKIENKGDMSELITFKLVRGDHTHEMKVAISRTIDSPLAPRIYGQVATGQLEELQQFTEDEAKAYARHFRVPGQTCSLLMLESEADYKRFDIKPENDAITIKMVKVDATVRNALKEAGDRLGSAKARFQSWTEKLESFPGLSFELSPHFKAAMRSLPEEAFKVSAEELVCKLRTRAEAGDFVGDLLKRSRLDYDAVSTASEERAKKGDNADALRLASSLVENNPGDTVVARDLAFVAMELGYGGHAYHLLRGVAESRPWEPDTYRLLARSALARNNADLAILYYELGLSAQWMGRYGEFRKILAFDYHNALTQIKRGELKSSLTDLVDVRVDELKKEINLEGADLVVTMTWNTDQTDVDLHVKEPTGQECYYQNPTTKIGGHITQDVTGGYGPEMYTLKEAKSGKYGIYVNYFSSNNNRSGVRTRVSITVYRNWGTINQNAQTFTKTLRNSKEKPLVTEITEK